MLISILLIMMNRRKIIQSRVMVKKELDHREKERFLRNRMKTWLKGVSSFLKMILKVQTRAFLL